MGDLITEEESDFVRDFYQRFRIVSSEMGNTRPKFKEPTHKNKRTIMKALNKFTPDEVNIFFTNYLKSDFLNGKKWLTLEWACKPDNFLKIMSGVYVQDYDKKNKLSGFLEQEGF